MTTIRQRQTPRARRVLGLFAAVWLNMALQPCAMAFGGFAQDDIEDCPPGTHGELLMFGVHDQYDEAMMDEPCNITGGQRAFLDDYDYDGRTNQLKVKHAPSDVPLGVALPVATSPLSGSLPIASGAENPLRHAGIQPSPNVLYCVYQI